MANATTNREGLTLQEWLAAANLGEKTYTLEEERKQRKAWRDGEDPTEWAAKNKGK